MLGKEKYIDRMHVCVGGAGVLLAWTLKALIGANVAGTPYHFKRRLNTHKKRMLMGKLLPRTDTLDLTHKPLFPFAKLQLFCRFRKGEI